MRPTASKSRQRPVAAALVVSLRAPRVGLVISSGFLALVALILTIDARRNELASFDQPAIDAAQRVDLPFLSQAVDAVNMLTNSTWAVVSWGLVLAALLVCRWWLPAVTVLAMPWGGFVNNLIGVHVVVRTRPDGDGLIRSVGDWNAPSFPSGHVMGAVMLYGFLIYLAPRMRYRWLRTGIIAVSLAVISTVGFARLWIGAHWPSDVLAAYALGGLVVVLLVMLLEQLEQSVSTLATQRQIPRWLDRQLTRR